MASPLPRQTSAHRAIEADSVVATIDSEEIEAARSDPRVKSFLAESDAYLAELERDGRNH